MEYSIGHYNRGNPWEQSEAQAAGTLWRTPSLHRAPKVWRSPISTFEHDSITFHYTDTGEGLPFVFQHGLGADLAQPAELYTPPPGVRMLSFEFRAHGKTHPIGPAGKIGIASFADDLNHFLEFLGLGRAVIGGISMGAAVAANFALRYPHHIDGLVLVRPAWLEGPSLENATRHILVAALLRMYGPEGGKCYFRQTELFRSLMNDSPGTAESLVAQFDNPRAVERAVRLERILLDMPYEKLEQLHAIRVPTLVLANRQDLVHPFFYGEAIRDAIPGAQLVEITPKSIDLEAHIRDLSIALQTYFRQSFLQD